MRLLASHRVEGKLHVALTMHAILDGVFLPFMIPRSYSGPVDRVPRLRIMVYRKSLAQVSHLGGALSLVGSSAWEKLKRKTVRGPFATRCIG